MSQILPSYLADAWTTGGGAGSPVLDAVTGQLVTRVSTDGLDLAGAVRHGREVGGPALRALGFQERAGTLKALALALSERKQELYDLSARAGSIRADCKVDVDGGFGTAIVYAGLGRKGLPDGNVVVEDEPIQMGKAGTFFGQHVLTPRRGVAVQINAFNFPVWGMMEKLAPALIAGVPSIVKPASQTAFITEHAVRIMLEADVLPEGALQLVSGPVPGLFDALGGQDLVGFTGSASTATRLRADRAVTERSVRFTAEADSLNSSALGPDAEPGTPEFDLYVDQLVTEMTTKAGQKCTAIRRAFVPEGQLQAVTDAVTDRLGKVVVGAPGAEGVTMGALVGLDQRDDVRAGVDRLRKEAELVFGDPDRVDVVGADDERGAFLSPLLLRAERSARAPHEVEAFGPVSTLLPYRDAGELIDLVARGEGSLAASVVSNDHAFVRQAVLGIAAHHGRVLVLDRDDAAESTGHGIPMPQLVHGGPGRAGGGEEEGGQRAVRHHLQRTAVQGGPGLAGLLTAGDAGEPT
jgi:oxepin-CoA hydrolase/3-oxo-5,6-dehydrosuberyl-CoA semialdehyde dehydrogenase